MAGPRSPFPLCYLDEAIGFLVPRSQVSVPGPRPRPAFRSFVPSFLRSLFTDLSQHHQEFLLPTVHLVLNNILLQDGASTFFMEQEATYKGTNPCLGGTSIGIQIGRIRLHLAEFSAHVRISTSYSPQHLTPP